MTQHECPRCELYDMSRGALIRAEIAKTSTGAEAHERWRRFLAEVHQRHSVTVGRIAALMALVHEETR